MEEVEREEGSKSLRSLPFLFDFHLRTLSSSLELSFSTLALPKCSRVAMKHKSLSFPSAELDKIRKLALQCRPGRILKILKSQTILCWEFYKQHPNTCLMNYVANVLFFRVYCIINTPNLPPKGQLCNVKKKKKNTSMNAQYCWKQFTLVTDNSAVFINIHVSVKCVLVLSISSWLFSL